MMLEVARRVVEQARVSDPDIVDARELAVALESLQLCATKLYNETQREAARWLAANAVNRPKSALDFASALPFVEMQALMQSVNTTAAETQDVWGPIRVGSVLLQLIDCMEDGLQYYWTRWQTVPSSVRSRRVEGAVLTCMEQGGQRSYRLAGRPVQEGVTVWLLTSAGWIAGIFHTNTGDPLFTFRLPGAAGQALTVQIPTRAVVAWTGG